MFKNKKFLIWAIVIVVIVIFSIVMASINASKNAAAIKSDLAEVTSGTIIDKVNGTGVVSANQTFDITSKVAGTVKSSQFDEGDSVKEGDVLYTIDSKEIEKQILTAKINLNRCEVTYRQSINANNDLTTVSQYSGKIQKLYVSKGDFVQSGTKIADVVDNENLILKIPFNTSDISKISVGSTASITLTSNSSVLQGSVSRIYDTSESLGGYRLVTYVEIRVKNPGAISKGEKAYSTVNGISCNSVGEFLNSVEKSIVSSGSGQIISLNVLEGNNVYKGQTVLTLKNDQVTNAISTDEIAIRDAKVSLENLEAQLDDYKILSPVSGVVVSKTIKKGDNAVPSTPMMTVSDVNNLYVNVEIDELYISKVKIGHQAKLTADALSNQSFSGVVDKINNVGVAKNGVTYYPVRVKISDPGALKVGMNLSVDIINKTKNNVLRIPKEATDGESVMLYENNKLHKVNIKIGIKDDKYYEVLSGLKKGDKVSVKRGN